MTNLYSSRRRSSPIDYCLIASGLFFIATLAYRSYPTFFAPKGSTHTSSLTCLNQPIDFGTITAGTEINPIFLLKNTSRHPIVLTEVRAACGCTTVSAGVNGRVIRPDASTTIPVKFNSRNQIDKVRKEIGLEYFGTSAESMRLELTGTIIPKYAIIPKIHNFGLVSPTSTHDLIIHIRSTNGAPVEIVRAHAECDWVDVKWQSGGADWAIVMVRVTPLIPQSRKEINVMIELDRQDKQMLIVPCRIAVESQYQE